MNRYDPGNLGDYRVNGEILVVFTQEQQWMPLTIPTDWEAVAAGQALTIALLEAEINKLKEQTPECHDHRDHDLRANPYNEPKSLNVTELDNGDIVYEDSVWWDFEGWNKGQNPVRTNWGDPLNLRLVFDKHGNLKDAKTLCYFGNFTITKET